MFDLTEGVTLYYLPELRVGSSLADRPAAVWRPRIEALGVVPREPASGMEFNMLWTSNRTVVVEACADLAAPIWSPVATITLTTDRDVFRDLQWTQSARRFYRLGSL